MGPLAMMLTPVMVGLLYAGTGGWTAERWNGALAIMGMGASAGGFKIGYETFNPDLHSTKKRRRRGPDGRFIAAPSGDITEGPR